MSDKGLMIGWEIWWAGKFNASAQKKAIVSDMCEKHSLKRTEAYKNLKKVCALLDPELAKYNNDLFLLMGRILSLTKSADNHSPAVAEVDLDTGEITYLEGWDDALAASLKACEFDKHPARYLHVLKDALEAERSRLVNERKQLDDCLSAVNKTLSNFRDRGAPKKIPDETAKPSTSKGLSAPK